MCMGKFVYNFRQKIRLNVMEVFSCQNVGSAHIVYVLVINILFCSICHLLVMFLIFSCCVASYIYFCFINMVT